MVGNLLSNTYRVKRLIGRGGMGEVYEAVHERTGAPFAIKILLADFSGKEELLTRFQREAEITSRLHHPNIVKVFDFDKMPDGRPFLAMEFLQGQPLDAADQTPLVNQPAAEVAGRAPALSPQPRAPQAPEAKISNKKPKKTQAARPSKPNEDIF